VDLVSVDGREVEAFFLEIVFAILCLLEFDSAVSICDVSSRSQLMNRCVGGSHRHSDEPPDGPERPVA
jgi:hypothetical protein